MPKKVNPIVRYRILKSLKKASPRNNQVSLAYVIGGVGAYFLGKFAYRYYKEHPEISRFFRENYEQLGERIREFGGKQETELPKH